MVDKLIWPDITELSLGGWVKDGGLGGGLAQDRPSPSFVRFLFLRTVDVQSLTPI